MIIQSKVFYGSIFSLLLLLQVYIPSFKLNVVIQLLVVLYFIITKQFVFTKQFFKLTAPLLILLVFPLFIGFFKSNELSFLIKDFSYYLKPILGLTLGYLFFKKIDNFPIFIKSVVYVGLISAFIHFIILLFFTNLVSGNVSQIREYGKDNFLELISLVLLLTHKRFTSQEVFNKRFYYYSVVFIAISCLMYLSRSMLIVAFLFFLSIKGYTIINYKKIKVIGIFIISVLSFYSYLFSIKIDRNATGIDGFLYKMKIAPSEVFPSKIDRDNHVKLWDNWRGYEAKRALALMETQPESYLVGTGFGSLIDLKFNSPLGEQKKGLRYISEIHNGYVFVFYKTGFLGLFLMLLFLVNLYRKGYYSKDFLFIFVSGIAVAYLFTTLTITGIFNKKDVLIMILGSFLYFMMRKNQSNENI